MNQQDYKAIAEIIKYHNFAFPIKEYAYFCNKMADYFEKEREESNKFGEYIIFNREQFLEDCEVSQ